MDPVDKEHEWTCWTAGLLDMLDMKDVVRRTDLTPRGDLVVVLVTWHARGLLSAPFALPSGHSHPPPRHATPSFIHSEWEMAASQPAQPGLGHNGWIE